MVIECENIRLSLVKEADLEMMRHWRNASHVNSQMEFRELINEEGQLKWFQNLDKKANLYYRINVNRLPVGIIHLKNIDWDVKTAEAGIFVGDKENLGTMSPIISIYMIMKLAFDVFQFNELKAKIADTNSNAIEFNTLLGYRFHEPLNPGFAEYRCSKDQFHHPALKTEKLYNRIKQNAFIKVYLGREQEWLLPYMDMEATGFQFSLL